MRIARRVLIFAVLWLLFEGAISLLATCDQVAEQASQNGGSQQTQKHCTALSGPVLASGWAFVYWLGHVLEGYGEAVIAVFTIVLAFATGLLWKATRDLVRSSERSAERQLRAYMSFELTSINVTQIPVNQPTSHGIEIGYVLTNAGQTPAHRVRVDTSFRTMKWPIPLGEKIKPPPPNALLITATIGPKQTRPGTMTKTRPVSDVELADMSNNGQLLYVVALITYDDSFGVERYTQYCGSLRNLNAIIAAGRNGMPIPKAQFATSEQYNDAS